MRANKGAPRSSTSWPQLAPILRDTYGVIAYQEQVMRIAAVLAGFSMGQSDMLRKAMGKKDPKVMAKQREAFMAGARTNGINEKKATKIFDLMEFFAGYGFNKSHSTTYAWIAYQTAFLKANYPAHFMAALLTIEAANTDKLAMYLGECRDLGVTILPPDLNSSELAFTVVDGAGRFGLGAVKNVGEGAILSMLNVRRELGRIDSLYALCEHADLRLVNKRVLESLVKAGAMDALLPESAGTVASRRARLFAAVDKAIENGGRHQRDRDKGQSQLFGGGEEGASADAALPDAPAWTEVQQLAGEKEALGLYMSGHPLDRFGEELKTFGARRVADLTSSEADVWVGGIVSGLRPLKTKKGDRMAVFMLDDVAGNVEVVVFPETLPEARRPGRKRRHAARARQARKRRRVGAHRRHRADADRGAQGKDHQEVVIHLRQPSQARTTFEALAELLSRHRGDRRVSLELDVNGPRPLRVRADVAQRVRPSDKLVAEVEQICGAGTVELR